MNGKGKFDATRVRRARLHPTPSLGSCLLWCLPRKGGKRGRTLWEGENSSGESLGDGKGWSAEARVMLPEELRDADEAKHDLKAHPPTRAMCTIWSNIFHLLKTL